MNQCVEEVKYYVHDYQASSIIPAIDGGVAKSDTRISPFDHKNLQKAIRSCAKDKRKTVNNDAAVDIVDPYLFPFEFGKTRTLRRHGLTLSDCIRRACEGEPAKRPSERDCEQKDPTKYPNDIAWSQRFQFLPFDIKFSDKGDGGCR